MSEMAYHYQTVGRILAYLVNRGLARVDLDPSDATAIMIETRGDEEQVHATFVDCLRWMLAEGLIRSHSAEEYQGGYSFMGVQLTSAGIALIRSDTKDPDIGGTIQERIANSDGRDLGASVYTKIGEFTGSFLGGFTKSIASG